MICREAGAADLRVLSFDAFKRMCLAKYEAADQIVHKMNSGCQLCETGLAIKEGRLVVLPENVEMMDMPEPATHPTALPEPFVALPLKQIPADRIDTLTTVDLVEFFTLPPLRKERGTCPICERVGIIGAANGLCGRCLYHAKGKTGREMLRALQDSLNPTRGGASQRVGKTVAIGTADKKPRHPQPPASTPRHPSTPPSTDQLAALRAILKPFGDEPLAAVAERVVKRVAELDRLYTEAQEECVAVQRQLKEATGRAPRTGMAGAIEASCLGVMEFLLQKNDAYGNSAADPVRIFSHADPLEQINVRIDDKLSRLMRGGSYPGDDDELDLLGYLMLKRAVRLYHAEQKREAA